jgi:hypothetical protein
LQNILGNIFRFRKWVVGIKSEIAPGILQDTRGNFSIISERLRNLVGTIIGKILLREYGQGRIKYSGFAVVKTSRKFVTVSRC